MIPANLDDINVIKLKCNNCGTEAEGTAKSLWKAGWDFPEAGIPVVTCSECPSAPLLFP